MVCVPEKNNERSYEVGYLVRQFLVEQMKIPEKDVKDLSIDRAHRSGKKKVNASRSIVFNLVFTEDKDYIMSYKRNLAKTPYNVSSQFPPVIAEKRRSLKKEMSSKYPF